MRDVLYCTLNYSSWENSDVYNISQEATIETAHTALLLDICVRLGDGSMQTKRRRLCNINFTTITTLLLHM